MKKYLILVNFLLVFMFALSFSPRVLAVSENFSPDDDTHNRDENKDADRKKSPFSKEFQEEEVKERSKKDFVTYCQNEGLESDKCREGLGVAFKTLKPILIQRLDKVCDHIGTMVDRAKAKDALTEEEKEALDDVFSECNAVIEEYKILLEDAETVDDLREIASSFSSKKEFLSKVKEISNNRDRVHLINVKRILAKVEAFIEKVENHIELAKNAGHDVSEAQKYVDDAKVSLIQAQDLVQTTSSITDTNILSEVKSNLRDAHASLKSAVRILRGLYKETPWEVK